MYDDLPVVPKPIITDARLQDKTFNYINNQPKTPYFGFVYQSILPHPEHCNEEIEIDGKTFKIMDILEENGHVPIWIFEMGNDPDPRNLEEIDVRLPWNCHKTTWPSLLNGDPIHLGALPLKPGTVDIPDMVTVFDMIEDVIRSHGHKITYASNCWYTMQKQRNMGILQHLERLLNQHAEMQKTHGKLPADFNSMIKDAEAMFEKEKNFFFKQAEDYAAAQHLKQRAIAQNIELNLSV